MSDEVTVNTEDNLAILRQLDRSEVRIRRHATMVAWLSVVGAAVAFAVVIFVGNQQLQRVRSEAAREQQTLTELQKRTNGLTEEIKAKTAEIGRLKLLEENYQASIVARGTPQGGENGGAAAKVERPSNPIQQSDQPLAPRVYLQIVNQADRQYAQAMRGVLEQAGFVVPGIEYMSRAAGLRNTEVRYYKKIEQEEAEKIADILRVATKEPIAVLYLALENAKVRPRHYEVWFRAHER